MLNMIKGLLNFVWTNLLVVLGLIVVLAVLYYFFQQYFPNYSMKLSVFPEVFYSIIIKLLNVLRLSKSPSETFTSTVQESVSSSTGKVTPQKEVRLTSKQMWDFVKNLMDLNVHEVKALLRIIDKHGYYKPELIIPHLTNLQNNYVNKVNLLAPFPRRVENLLNSLRYSQFVYLNNVDGIKKLVVVTPQMLIER